MISIDSWRSRGRMLDTPDGRIFAIDVPGEAPVPVLALHGFPTSSWDFAAAIEKLSPRRRVVAFDFIGMGLSDKPATHGYSLFEQADVAIHVAKEMGVTRCHLWAHDMGTS